MQEPGHSGRSSRGAGVVVVGGRVGGGLLAGLEFWELVSKAVRGARPPRALSREVKVSTTVFTAFAALLLGGLEAGGGDFVAGGGGGLKKENNNLFKNKNNIHYESDRESWVCNRQDARVATVA